LQTYEKIRMPVKKKIKEDIEITDVIIEGILQKKGEKIVSIDFSKFKNAIFRGFVICHGNSGVHVESIADSVEEHVRKQTGIKPWHKEGQSNAEWILLDYVDLVVHVFQEKFRDFYQLENLWADADIKYIGSEKKLKKDTKINGKSTK
jgi:ribosome-associated protein